MRRLAVVLALASVLWQHAVVVTAQIVVCCQSAFAAEPGDTLCRCVHGPDATCPMHHRSSTRSPDQSGRARWCQNCADQGDAVLTGVSGELGTLPQEVFRALVPPPPTTVVFMSLATPADAARPPTIPPPRS